MAICSKILISGFSGSGKTSLLKEIATIAPAGWSEFEDLDQLVFKSRGKGFKDLSSLIQTKGWESFRLWERQELEGWLKEEGQGVLALGGGTLSPLLWDLYNNSRKIKFCYLDVNFETCWSRLLETHEERPLVLKGKSELQKIYDERMKVFSQIQWKIKNENTADIKQLAREFWSEINF